jgi:hypothetical protein
VPDTVELPFLALMILGTFPGSEISESLRRPHRSVPSLPVWVRLRPLDRDDRRRELEGDGENVALLR